jgi:hypothetical protein
MRDDALLHEIERDLQRSPGARVVYLEGPSDPAVFFALLGVGEPLDLGDYGFEHDGVLVRGLPADRGSGASAVRRRVQLAGERGRRHVYGFVDGDGEAHERLAPAFDAPFAGPLFRWKAYAIENLLVRASWPAHWGREPSWPGVFRRYAPYVALNRLHAQIRKDLALLGLAGYQHPVRGLPLWKNKEVVRRLKAQEHLLPKRDVLQAYRHEVHELLDATLDEQHARLDGKWIVEELAPSMTGRSEEQCRAEWIRETAGRGGDREVRSLWERALRPSRG